MDSKNIKGGCYCGAIRYKASVDPLASMICNCLSCQRIAGSPEVAWVTFPRQQLHFTRGKPNPFRSSPKVFRTFCPSCGTPLTYECDRWPEEVDVTTCTLDNPEAFPPTHHSWWSHKPAWVRPDDDLPCYPETREDAS